MIFDNNSVLPHINKAVELARNAGLQHDLVEYLSDLAISHGNIRNSKASMAASQEAVSLSKEINSKRLELEATRSLVVALYQQKNYDMALPLVETALQLALEIGDIHGELGVLNNYGLILLDLRKWVEAEEIFLKIIKDFDLLVFHRVLFAVNNIVPVQMALGEYEKYHCLVVDLMEKARQAGNEYMSFRLTEYYTESCFRLGKYKESHKELVNIWPYVDRLDDQFARVSTLTFLGVSSGLVGDFNSSHDFLEISQTYHDKFEDSFLKANIWILSAYVGLLDSNTSAYKLGLEHIERGIAIWLRIVPEISWFPYFVLAGLHLALADEDSTHLHEAMSAIELALENHNKYLSVEPPESLFFMASKVYRANNRPEEADDYLSKAHDRVILVAEKIQADDLRQSYLENVKDNQEILREAKERGMVME